MRHAGMQVRMWARRTRQREVDGEHAVRGPRLLLVRHAALAQHPRDAHMKRGTLNLHLAYASPGRACRVHACAWKVWVAHMRPQGMQHI